MAHDYTPPATPTYNGTYHLPDDGVDKRTAATVNTPLQTAADDIKATRNDGTTYTNAQVAAETARAEAAESAETSRAEAAEAVLTANQTIKSVTFTGAGDHNWVVPADCICALGDGYGAGGGGGGGGTSTTDSTQNTIGGGGGAGARRRVLGIPGLVPGETAVIHVGSPGGGGGAIGSGADGGPGEETKITYGAGVVHWPGGLGGAGASNGDPTAADCTVALAILGFAPGGWGDGTTTGLTAYGNRQPTYAMTNTAFQTIGSGIIAGFHAAGPGAGGSGLSPAAILGDNGKGWPQDGNLGGAVGAAGANSGGKHGGGPGGGGGAGPAGAGAAGGNGGQGDSVGGGGPANFGHVGYDAAADSGAGGGGGGGGGQGNTLGAHGGAGGVGGSGALTIYYVASV